jgi:hypothetical protein
MSTIAQLTANVINAQSSTGPRTEAGLSASSKNATSNGLYATHDFIRPGEDPLYEELNAALFHDLAPAGVLECNLVDEIRRAMWRLRRCGLVEESFSALGDTADTSDPMQVESQARLQISVDRARSQAHRLLHKCTAELRKLQTERVYRNEAFDEGTDLSTFGICDWPSIETRLNRGTAAISRRQKAQAKAELDAFYNAPPPDYQSGSFCKSNESPAPAIPRAA